jgi:peptidoglycan/LPS O-acetylase OafA/YrhL
MSLRRDSAIVLLLLAVIFGGWGIYRQITFTPTQILDTPGTSIINLAVEKSNRWHLFGTHCFTARWETENIQTITVNGEPTVGVASNDFCLDAPTLDFSITFPDSSTLNYDLYHYSPAIWYYLLTIAFIIGASLSWWTRPLPQPKPDTSNEIRALTSLRFIAAVMVFWFHIDLGGTTALSTAFRQHGYLGVTVFFVLSGFLITIRYYPVFSETISWNSYWSYLYRRIARIYPLFAFLFVLWVIDKEVFTLANLFHITLNQGWFASLVTSGIGPAWSLTVEMSFYVLAPLIFISIGRLSRNMTHNWQRLGATIVILAVWGYGLSLLGQAVDLITPDGQYGFFNLAGGLRLLTIFYHFKEFAFGMLIGFVFLQNRFQFLQRNRWHQFGTVGVLLLWVIQYLLLREKIFPSNIYNPYTLWYTAAATALLIPVLTVQQNWLSRLLSFSVLVYLGKVSYALYLVHNIRTMDPARELVNKMAITEEMPIQGMVLLLFGVFLSIPLYEWIEKPARRGLLKMFSSLPRPMPGVIQTGDN